MPYPCASILCSIILLKISSVIGNGFLIIYYLIIWRVYDI
jgi:hypothetical protein